MAYRYTHKDAEHAFERLCKALGKREAARYDDVGGWRLDYGGGQGMSIGVYGGYVVEEIASEGGAIRMPLGYQRRNAREFCEAVYFAVSVLRAAEEGKA